MIDLGYCKECGNIVSRKNPSTGKVEMLNGESPLTEEISTLPGWKNPFMV